MIVIFNPIRYDMPQLNASNGESLRCIKNYQTSVSRGRPSKRSARQCVKYSAAKATIIPTNQVFNQPINQLIDWVVYLLTHHLICVSADFLTPLPLHPVLLYPPLQPLSLPRSPSLTMCRHPCLRITRPDRPINQPTNRRNGLLVVFNINFYVYLTTFIKI